MIVESYPLDGYIKPKVEFQVYQSCWFV